MKQRSYEQCFAQTMAHNPAASRTIIAGIDEAGRGPLAGPVLAAACILTDLPHPIAEGLWSADGCIIGDSKRLSPDERAIAYDVLTRHCAWGIGCVEADVIDRIGILEATQMAMQQAVAMLAEHTRPTYLLIDGRDRFWFDYPHSSVIRGDSLEPTIAAASIIAKVTRDRLMTEADVHFPLYGFARHKGYGTPEHRNAIHIHGPCVLHRRTFLRDRTPRTDDSAPCCPRNRSLPKST
jgi:ribonuclease HII